jgi:hypothetical protein
MTDVSDDKLFARFKANPPASRDSIVRCQANLGFRLPDEYVRFLQQMNGGEGFIGKHYFMAWPIEELVPANKQCVVDDAVAALFLFGSDGGGEAFAFDTRSAAPPIVVVPFVGMELSVAEKLAPDFNSFLQFLYRSDDLF